MKKFYRLIGILVSISIPLTALANTWAWTSEPTPGSTNLIVTETGEVAGDYSNGTLSDAIILSEVMPNPEGTDTDTEWIELYNTGSTNVDLGNWSVDDEDGGSSPYVFPAGTVIEAQDFLVVYRSDSNISLNNDTDEARLFDFEGSIQDSVLYEGSPEGESYARISLEANNSGALTWLIPTASAGAWYEGNWEWTQDITQGMTNPIYHAISGIILESVPFEDQIQLESGEDLLTVSLEALDLNGELKQSIFSAGNQITGFATLKNNVYELKRFSDVLAAPSIKPSPTQSRKSIYLILTMMSGIGLYIYKRKILTN